MALKDYLPSFFGAKNMAVPLGRYLNTGYSIFSNNNPETLMNNGYKKNNHVYSVVQRQTRTASRVKVDLFKDEDQIEQHPALDIIRTPNGVQGWGEFIENLLGFKLTQGEVFIHMLWPDNGMNAKQPKQMYIIPPMMVEKINVNGYGEAVSYNVRAGASTTTIPANEIIHMKYWNPDSSLRGRSPLAAAAASIQTSNDAYIANMKALQNGGPAGILSGVNEGYPLGAEEAGLIQEKFYNTYTGSHNKGKIIVTGASMSWEQIGLSPIDLAILEQNQWSLRDICNVYGLTSQLFNDPENKTHANMKEARIDLIVNVVEPEIDNILDEFTRAMLPLFKKAQGMEYRTNLTGFQELKADEAALTNSMAQAWWLTPNERRQRMGLDQIESEGMNDIWTPTGVMPMDTDFGDFEN